MGRKMASRGRERRGETGGGERQEGESERVMEDEYDQTYYIMNGIVNG